jgi:flagellar biosynthesis/type III secretory pathway protein FliH
MVTNEEDDVSAEIDAWYQGYLKELQAEKDAACDQARNEGRNEGREEARCQGARRLLRRLLRARFGELPADAAARIEAAGAAELDRWADLMLGAHSLADVLDTQS